MSAEDDIALLSRHFDMKLHLLQWWECWECWGRCFDFLLRVVVEGRGLWFWTKAWNTLLMLACIGYAFFVLNWHMLNFNLNY